MIVYGGWAETSPVGIELGGTMADKDTPEVEAVAVGEQPRLPDEYFVARGWVVRGDMYGGEPAKANPNLYGTHGIPMERAKAEMPARESDPAAYAKDVERGFVVPPRRRSER